MTSGYVFDIQNCSMHDGPGLRTTVFFKGCPLRCLWCANPESQLQRPQVMFYADKCVGCGECVKVCESGAITSGKGCIGCGNCVKACIHNARKMVGKLMTVVTGIEMFKITLIPRNPAPTRRPFLKASNGFCLKIIPRIKIVNGKNTPPPKSITNWTIALIILIFLPLTLHLVLLVFLQSGQLFHLPQYL